MKELRELQKSQSSRVEKIFSVIWKRVVIRMKIEFWLISDAANYSVCSRQSVE